MEETHEIYERLEDGTTVLKETKTVIIPVQDIIADKEAELLKIYAELQALKEQTNS